VSAAASNCFRGGFIVLAVAMLSTTEPALGAAAGATLMRQPPGFVERIMNRCSGPAHGGMDALARVASHLSATFEKNRAKASERWERRQRALPTPGQVILGFAAHYADISTLDETGMEETRFDIEQEIAREKGIPDDQARHMMSHYHTLRPSTAQLKPRARDGVKAMVILDKDVEGLEAGEHILAPTHEDEEAIAHRRMEIGKERRFRKHRVQKSHIS